VYGGKNDNLQNEKMFFDDIFILNLDTLTWQAIASRGMATHIKKCGHSTAVVDTKLIVFGGKMQYFINIYIHM
jgi:N-acetylneuraminic acid mutarotase